MIGYQARPGIRWSRECEQAVRGLVWTRQAVIKRNGAISIMVGRPRKIGKRERNGRVQRTYENPKAQVMAQPHRRSVPKQHREWPEAESEFGRMLIRGAITRAQYEAGMRFARLAVAFCAVYDIPSPNPHAMDLTRVGVSQGREMPSEKAVAIKLAYNAAFDACAEGGRKAQLAVKDHAVLDKPVGDFETLKVLITGLAKLAHHFGLDPESQIRFRH